MGWMSRRWGGNWGGGGGELGDPYIFIPLSFKLVPWPETCFSILIQVTKMVKF